MKATETTLNTFLEQNKTQFVIPVYQRNYDWKEAQCKQLFYDIIKVGSEDELSTHFIGSIVFIHEGVYTSSEVKALVIIDGQQRLTTISLLYLALYKYAVESDRTAKATELNETFIINKFVSKDDSKLKLKPTENNAKTLKYLMADNSPKEYGEYSKVIENYLYFKNRINEENFDTILLGLRRLLFVEISLERGKDDPQRIFESLNSTGLELSQADLIRNYILMGLEPKRQIQVFNTYWEVIESNAKNEVDDKSRVSAFIRDYLTIKNKKIPNRGKVYEEFKSKYNDRDAEFYNAVLGELKELSYIYNKLINPKNEQDPKIRQQLLYIKKLEINTSYPFLLSVYQDYGSGTITMEELVEVLRTIQSFTWRRFILNIPTNALNKIFMTLNNDVDTNNYVDSIKASLLKKTGYQRWPNDIEIKNALSEKDVYNIQSKNKLYLLELLENYNNKEYVSIDNPNITIEHIFPQNPVKDWSNDLDQDEMKLMGEKYLNTIANLTLSGNNGALSNKSFQAKKSMNVDGGEQGYIYSSLWLNRYLKEIDQWTPLELRKRFDLLLERFYAIWSYPDDIDIDIDSDSAEYTIYNSPNPIHKKLEYYIFRDEKVIEKEVAKMYYHIMTELFNENPSSFFNSELHELIPIKNDRDALRYAYELNENYFIEANIDNNSKFRKLKMVLSHFDLEDELIIKYG